MARVRERFSQSVSHLLEAVVEDFWDDPCQQRATDLETGVRVYFDQIESEVFVDHEVVAKQLAQMGRE